jgi:hypothetical protein
MKGLVVQRITLDAYGVGMEPVTQVVPCDLWNPAII